MQGRCGCGIEPVLWLCEAVCCALLGRGAAGGGAAARA
jgi:hypothetical protein